MDEKTKRFFEVLNYLKVSGYKLSKQSELVTQQKLTNARNGRNIISTDVVMELCRLYEQVNPNYILTGKGSMLKTGDISQTGSNNSANNNGTINNTTTNNYRGCGGADKKAAQDILDLGDRVAVLGGGEGSLVAAPIRGSVPFYGGIPVSAGKGDLATILEETKPTGWINIPGMPSSIGAFPVIGCSMEPDIMPGDFIAIAQVDRWEYVDPNKTYMVITNDDRMIKHLAIDNDDENILWCISPNYPKFKIYKEDIRMIYRVTFHGRFM